VTPHSQTPQDTELLIIGAGPFGLSLAAYATQHGIDYTLVGRPMEFWHKHIPRGMYLRSACDWHLDPANRSTIERFLELRGQTPADVEPLSLQFYLEYTQWFQEQQQIAALPRYVERLDRIDDDAYHYLATLEDGSAIRVRHVAIAVGFKYFKHLPADLLALLPEGRFSHTCDLVAFDALAGKRCLILGGRQSAFEWAALLHEAGAAAVHLSHRHPSPAFTASDWSWVNLIVDGIAQNPGWFRNLPEHEQVAVGQRLWTEGRLKVEPWLAARVRHPSVSIWPETRLAACDVQPGGEMVAQLDCGERLVVDHIILATGYKVNIDQVPFLASGNIAAALATRNGFPVLDEQFQANLPGLFITSMAASQDFGPFFAFTISTRTSAKLIGAAIAAEGSTIQARAISGHGGIARV
jgi:cation diffusion facilitator CzcD-associated flavoprotein CzcO